MKNIQSRLLFFCVFAVMLVFWAMPQEGCGSSTPIVPAARNFNTQVSSSLKNNQGKESLDYVPGEVIIKLKERGTTEALLQKRYSERKARHQVILSKIKSKYKLRDAKPVFRELHKRLDKGNLTQKEDRDRIGAKFLKRKEIKSQSGALKGEQRDLLPIYVLKTEDKDILKACEKISQDDDIAYAEPNYIATTSYVPTATGDPLYSQQWAHKKTAIESAWDITRGSSSVVVAIIDTGVDYNHEDLKDNIWRDEHGHPGKDFVDVQTSNYTDAGYQLLDAEDYDTVDDDPVDFNGHGTHCTGIVAAKEGNYVGAVGVCPQCKIMPVRAGFSIISPQGSESGSLEYDDILNAIDYAVANGADVLSMSFGSSYPSETMKAAVDNAYAQGVILVAAAGNANSSEEHYPASYDNVISVVATAADDSKAYYSNYGPWVKVAAPGGDAYKDTMILSTVPKIGGRLTNASGYKSLQGTSMACPYVAGLAGLLASYYPGIVPTEVEFRLAQSADDLGKSGKDDIYGWGRVNAARSLQWEFSTDILLGEYKFTSPSSISAQRLVPGDQIELVINLFNVTSVPLADVKGVLKTTDPSVQINTSVVSLGSYQAKELKNNSGSPFLITLSPETPYGQEIAFELDVLINGVKAYTFPLEGKVIEAVSSHPIISIDDYKGNNNSRLDPGETVEVRFAMKIPGAKLKNASIELECSNPAIHFDNPVVEALDKEISKGEVVWNYKTPWVVTVDSSALPGEVASCKFKVRAEGVAVAVFEENFEIASEEKIIYVDAGNDSGVEDGSSAYPFVSIQKAVDMALSDEHYWVSVAPGTYTEKITLKSGVDVIGSGPEETIIDAQGTQPALYAGSDVITPVLVSGFTIQGVVGSRWDKGAVQANFAPVEVKNCIFKDNYPASIAGLDSFLLIRGNRFFDLNAVATSNSVSKVTNNVIFAENFLIESMLNINAAYFVIINNYFNSSPMNSLDGSKGDFINNFGRNGFYLYVYYCGDSIFENNYWENFGLYVYESVNIILQDNEINFLAASITDSLDVIFKRNMIRNDNYDIRRMGGISTSTVSRPPTLYMYNNVIFGRLALRADDQGVFSLFNNIIYGATFLNNVFDVIKNNIFIASLGIPNPVSGKNVSYNDFFYTPVDLADSAIKIATGNIFEDPLLGNLEEQGYWLKTGSPCIDAGDPSASSNDQDGSRNDMGVLGGKYGAEGVSREEQLNLTIFPEGPYVIHEGETLNLQLGVDDPSVSAVRYEVLTDL